MQNTYPAGDAGVSQMLGDLLAEVHCVTYGVGFTI